MKKNLTIALLALSFAFCRDKQGNPDAGREVKQYTIAQFYESTNTGGGSFSQDAAKLLISNNATGIYNAYEIDIATGKIGRAHV